MSYTWYEVFWFFLLYSFAGWVIGTSGAALKEKKFIDVGFYLARGVHPTDLEPLVLHYFYQN